MSFLDDIFGDEKPQAPTPVAYPAPPSLLDIATQANQAAGTSAMGALGTNQSVLPAYAQLSTDISKSQSPQLAELYAMIQNLVGPSLSAAMVNNAKTIDPTGFANREQLGQSTLSDLQRGGELTDKELQNAQNDIRSGQVARGGGTGIADAIKEASQLNLDRFGRNQQRQQAASNFINGRTVQGLGQVQAPVSSPNVNQFAVNSIDPSQFAGIQEQNYGIQNGNVTSMNNLANNQWQYTDQNTSNPFLEGLSAFGGFAAPIAGGILGGPIGAGIGQQVGNQFQNAVGGYPKAQPLTGLSLN